MELLNYKGFEGSAELDMSSLVCRGKLLFIDDLVTYKAGAPADLRREFESAVDDYIKTCQELGREPQRPFRGQFNVRVPAAMHRSAVLRALTDDVHLNEVVVRALEVYLNPCAQVSHNTYVTVQASEKSLRTISTTGSSKPRWEVQLDN
jgi:predicted HicB family RNase H-like nuclease